MEHMLSLYGVLKNLFGLRITAVCIKHFAPVTYIQIQFCNKSIYNYPAYMYIIYMIYTGLFKMIVWVLTTCHSQYT